MKLSLVLRPKKQILSIRKLSFQEILHLFLEELKMVWFFNLSGGGGSVLVLFFFNGNYFATKSIQSENC